MVRTNTADKDFLNLVQLLDQELAVINGKEHTFFSQFNTLGDIRHFVVAYENDNPVACGAMKENGTGTMEIKRMFTKPEMRGKKLAALILAELENWAAELGYQKCILETGKQLPSAIQLYLRQGYKQTDKYGQYVDSENSVCFEKYLQYSE